MKYSVTATKRATIRVRGVVEAIDSDEALSKVTTMDDVQWELVEGAPIVMDTAVDNVAVYSSHQSEKCQDPDCFVCGDGPQVTKHWRCQECGHKDEKKPMPKDRAAFYLRVEQRGSSRCPSCGSIGFMPVGF